jgi:hypothetical protein
MGYVGAVPAVRYLHRVFRRNRPQEQGANAFYADMELGTEGTDHRGYVNAGRGHPDRAFVLADTEMKKYRLVLEPTEAGQYLAFVQCRLPNSSVWEGLSGKGGYVADELPDLLRLVEQELLRMVGA